MTLTATASRARLAMQRLRQSTSMSDFVGELADLLVCAQAPGSCRSTRRSAHSRSLHARVHLKADDGNAAPAPWLPPVRYYTTVIGHLDAVGWDRVADLDASLRRVTLAYR